MVTNLSHNFNGLKQYVKMFCKHDDIQIYKLINM